MDWNKGFFDCISEVHMKASCYYNCLSDYSRLSEFYVHVWCPYSASSAMSCAVELAGKKKVCIIWSQLFCISSKMLPLACNILLICAALITVFGDNTNVRLGTFAYTIDFLSWKFKTVWEHRQEQNYLTVIKSALRATKACFNPGLTSLVWTRLGGALVMCLPALGSSYLSEPPCIQPHICRAFTVMSRDVVDVDVSQQVVKYDGHFTCSEQLFLSCILNLLFSLDFCDTLIWIIASPDQSEKMIIFT